MLLRLHPAQGYKCSRPPKTCRVFVKKFVKKHDHLRRGSMYKYRLSVILVCLVSTGSIGQTKRSNSLDDPRWKPAGVTQYETLTYDSKTLKETAEGTIIVWIQFKYTSAGKLAILKNRVEDKLSVRGYDQLESSVHQYELNCIKRTMRVLAYVDYATDDTVLASKTLDDDTWHAVVPGSIIELILEVPMQFCKKELRPPQTSYCM